MIAYSYVLPTGTLILRVQQTSYPIDKLLGIAARANTKRGFLFLSRVLGKHAPVSPDIMAETHRTLAATIPPTCHQAPIIFLAMAETAIGLGQGIFEAYVQAHPEQACLFLHSTRYFIEGHPALDFEESHSHAPTQFLHIPLGQEAQHLFFHAQTLVLIDDEASTGKTFQHLVQCYRKQNPSLQHVHIALLTNFMSAEHQQHLEKACVVPCTFGALLEGSYTFQQKNYPQAETSLPAQVFKTYQREDLSISFGRLGVTKKITLNVTQLTKLTALIRPNENVLVLGTGEFMHAAFLLGRFLEERGVNVAVQATTRSPILRWGAVSEIIHFADNYHEGIPNFLYNAHREHYQHCLICHETPPSSALFDLAKQVKGRLFYFQKENHIEEIFIS